MSVRWPTDLICVAGGRSCNDDYCNFVILDDMACWVLANGQGDPGSGGAASYLVVNTILQTFSAAPEVSLSAIEAYIGAADRAIRAKQAGEPPLAGIGSTVVVMLAGARGVLWAHVGNSRLYHFRGGRVVSQTTDHSAAQALVDAGETRLSQIRFHPDRRRLSRCLGRAAESHSAIAAKPADVQMGDAFLLATDGFWEFLSETEMEVELSKALTPSDWLRTMELRIREKVSGENDSYAAVGILVPWSIETTT